MTKFDLGRIFDNKRLMMLFSILLAVISWLVVVYYIDTSSSRVIGNILVDAADQQAAVLEPVGLKIVDGGSERVKVTISGERYLLNNITADDIVVSSNLSGITAAGTYNNITLTAADKYPVGGSPRFTVTEISPATITLKIDRPVTKKFAITTDIEGLQSPDDYLRLDTVVNPKEVTITGPEVDINKIDKCVVSATFTDPLTASTTKSSEIKLYNSEGTELAKSLLTLDNETADITIPVLKQKWVPLNFDFNRVPNGFPIEELDYSFMDKGEILVAGPEAAVDDYLEVPLGYVNVNEIRSGGFVQTFDVSLPSGFVNVDQIKQVDVMFNTQEMQEASFTVTNIKAINVPANYEVTITTSQITDVNIVGDPAVMESLTAEDLVAEIDLSSREVTPGPYNAPVTFSIPGKKLAWATGEYTAVIGIKEK